MMRYRQRGIRFRIFVIVAIAVIPGLLLTLYSAVRQRNLAAEAVRQDALRITRLVSATNDRVIEAARQLLVALTEMPAIKQEDADDCNRLLARLLAKFPQYTILGVLRPDGMVACSSAPTTGPMSLADRAYFQRAISTRKFAIGDYQIGRLSHRASVNVGYPILDASGSVQSVLFAGIDLSYMGNLLGTIQLPPQSSMSVLDSHGTVLVRQPQPEKWIGKTARDTPLLKAFEKTKRNEGTLEAAGLDGVDRLYGFTRLQAGTAEPAVLVSVGIPRKVAFAGVYGTIARNLIAVAVLAALVLIGEWLIAERLIMRNMKAMALTAERLAGGDLTARTGLPERNRGELSYLAQTIDQMAKSLQRRERFTRTLIEEMPVGVIACDALGYLVVFNRAARELHGLGDTPLPPEDWGERYDVYDAEGKDLLDPDDHPLARVLKGKQVSGARITIAPKDGPKNLVAVTGGPMLDEKGQNLGFLAIMHRVNG